MGGQERARAAFGRVMARYRALQQQQQRAETSDKCVQAEVAARCLSRAVQCEPVRLGANMRVGYDIFLLCSTCHGTIDTDFYED